MTTSSSVIQANAALFMQGYIERNWLTLSERSTSEAVAELCEVTAEAVIAALHEADKWPSDESNPEAMIAQGQDYVV